MTVTGRQRLKVLHLEDDPDDAYLVERALGSGDFEPEVTLARSREAFRKALERGPFDVIVCDNGIPGFDGHGALELSRELAPGVPVVFLTGSVDPNVALERLRAGAADVVSKDDLWRLNAAIRHAVGVSERDRDARRDAWKANAMARLVAVVQQLSRARRLEDVQSIVRRAARDLTGADGATFVLRDGDKCFYADEDAIAPLWKGSRFPMDACISGWAMLNHRSVAITDIYADPRIPHDAYRPTFVQSLAMAPIRSDDPIGAIGTYWARIHEPTREELEVLQALADTTSVAIANVDLIQGLERRVEERTRELAAANKELESFSYSIAHDLRAPLTAIRMFSEALVRDPRTPLDAEGRQHVDRIRGSVQRMQGMIQALLSMSQTTRVELSLEDVDLSQLARERMAELRAAAPEREAEVEIDDGLTARADPRLMRIVLDNLLGNAWKYTARRERARIRFTSRRGERGERVFVVSDDGAGFDMRYAAKLFTPFQRMHGEDEFPGDGIGLATAQRILQRHGGRIWAEAEVDRGAKFCFTLP